ncbi:MAG: hypothetical protein ABFR05_08775 [Bacteroidota bacterium]
MMKNSLITVLALLFFSSGIAQSNKSEQITLEKQILKRAKLFSDLNVAKTSMYKIIELEGENSTYKDSLAYVYFSERNYAPCFMVTNEVLKREPKNKEMLEMQAVSLESLGAYGKAVESYEKLYDLTNLNYYGYSVAKLKYNTKQFEEAYTLIQQVEKLNDSGKYHVTYAVNQNYNQQVELLAAIQYLKGVISEELNKNDIAKAAYKKALTIQTDFALAKDNLNRLEEEK